jgi:hypothetical protein
MNVFRNSALCAACVLLAAGTAHAKPDKDKGEKGGGGGQGNSEKQKGGGKHENKGNADKGDKTHKEAGKDQKENGKSDNGKADDDNVEWRKKSFRDDDRTSVVRYFSGFSDQERGLPPGLAKNYLRGKPLPPGWQKKVYGGYVIEDDFRDYFHPLEYSLFPGLEVVPDTRLYLYGNRIVRVYEPRREVIDIIEVPTIRFD